MDSRYYENMQSSWSLVILLGLPVLFALATWVYKKRKSKGEGVIPPQIVRWFLVPFLGLHLVLTKVFEFPESSAIIKLSKSIIVLVLLSFLISAINYFFFSKNNVLTGKEIIPKLGRDVIHILLISFVGACVMSHIWGLDLGNLLTALGVSSLVIGLALQEPLGNLFNGVSLLMANPFRKGDWIKVGDDVGKVAEINWRSVKIHTRLNEEIVIPNNLLGKSRIKNMSRPNKIHAELLKFPFSYDDSPEKAKASLLETATANNQVLKEPKPVALTLSFDDYAIVYGLKIYLEDYQDSIVLRDEIISAVYKDSRASGLTMPFPQQEIEMKLSDSGLGRNR
ncbi:mechanosensitive ion channel family protein [Chitinophagales bacterium]|nr:mechanosensitive ion channel family protein [Chitinophagales bacterium]